MSHRPDLSALTACALPGTSLGPLVDPAVPLLLKGGRASDLERAATRLHTASRPGRRLVRLDGKTTGRERPALQRITVDVAWDDAGVGSVVVADLFRLAIPVQLRLAELADLGAAACPRLIGLVVDDQRRASTRVARALLDNLLVIDLPPVPREDPDLVAAFAALERGDSIDLNALRDRAVHGVESLTIAHALRQLAGDRERAARRLGITRPVLEARLEAVRQEGVDAEEEQTFSVVEERDCPAADPAGSRRRVRRRERFG